MGRNRPTVAQLIENLPFVDIVNTMLLEGTSAPDVATFIQEDQGSLGEIPRKSLINVLTTRKRSLREERESGDGDGEPEVGVGSWFDTGQQTKKTEKPRLPSQMAREAYKRLKGGIQEMHELEALYLSQRDRLDRLLEKEHSVGAFSDQTATEMKTAADLLMKRVTVKEKLGVLQGDSGSRGDVRDFDGYTEETAKVFSNPKSRRRVLSLVERLRSNEEALQEAEGDEGEDPPAAANG